MHRYESKMNLTLLIVLLLSVSALGRLTMSQLRVGICIWTLSLKFWAILLSILTVLEKNGQIVGK